MVEIYYGPYGSYGIISYRNKIENIEATVLPEGIHIDGDYIHGPAQFIRRMLRRIQRQHPNQPIIIFIDSFETNAALKAALKRFRTTETWTDGRFRELTIK